MPIQTSAPKTMEDLLLDGPIPGENYTSDTKNYPWHRPPEIDDMNVAVEKAMSELFSPKGVTSYANLMEMDATVAQLTSLYIMNGIERGLWTVDYGLLLAGPVSRMIEIIGKMNGIEYEMGLPSIYGNTDRTMEIVDRDSGEDALGAPMGGTSGAGEASFGSSFMDMGGAGSDFMLGDTSFEGQDSTDPEQQQLSLF